MGFGNVNLGNLATALSMTGGNPSLADQLKLEAAQQQPAPAPASPIPPATNQALEATGSAYRVPEAAPPATPEPAPSAPAPAEPAQPAPYTGTKAGGVNPNAGVNELKGRVAGNVGTGQALETELGDTRARGQTQSAEVLRADAAEGRAGIDEVKGRRGEAMKRKDANREGAYHELEDLRTAMGHPPDVSKGKWLALIGGAIGASGKGGPLGAVLQGMGQMQMGELERWQQGMAGNEKIAKMLTEMNDSEDKGTDSELNQQSKLNAMVTANSLNALGAIEHETKSDEVRNLAQQASLKLKDAYEQHDLGVKQKLAATAATKAADQAMYRAIASAGSPGERQAVAYTYGAKGAEVLKTMQANDKGLLDVEAGALGNRKTEADIRKTDADTAKLALEGGPQQIIPGYFSTPGMALDPGTIGDLRKNARAMASLQDDLAQLREIRMRNNGGTWDPTDVSTAESILAGMPAKRSQMSGSGAPSEQENKAFSQILTNPTEYFARKDPVSIYDSISQSLQQNYDAQADVMGVRKGMAPTVQNAAQPARAAAPAAAAAKPAAPARVTLYRLDGTPVPNVKADMAQKLLATQQYSEQPPAPAPAPAGAALASADNASYEDEVRKQNGY